MSLKETRIAAGVRELLRQREDRRGLLVAFEGPDGSGKTTQRKLFKEWLEGEGRSVITTKWNSSELIKPLIKARKAARALSPEEFCLLHAADFQYRLETVVLPALWKGKTVVADRYLFTALARDEARGLSLEWLLNVYRPLFWPDVVFYFSVSPDTAASRIAATRTPKFYEAGQDMTGVDDPVESYRRFTSRVIRGYEELAAIFRFVTIDAEQSIYDQHRLIREKFQELGRIGWVDFNAEALADWLPRRGAGTQNLGLRA